MKAYIVMVSMHGVWCIPPTHVGVTYLFWYGVHVTIQGVIIAVSVNSRTLEALPQQMHHLSSLKLNVYTHIKMLELVL